MVCMRQRQCPQQPHRASDAPAQDSGGGGPHDMLHRFLTLHGGEEPDPAVVQYLHGILPTQDVSSGEVGVRLP